MKDRKVELEKAHNDVVDSELYEELLNRYERALVFAGQLKEKLDHQKLLAEQNEDLQQENERLEKIVALDEAYIKLLERSLASLGVFEREED